MVVSVQLKIQVPAAPYQAMRFCYDLYKNVYYLIFNSMVFKKEKNKREHIYIYICNTAVIICDLVVCVRVFELSLKGQKSCLAL